MSRYQYGTLNKILKALDDLELTSGLSDDDGILQDMKNGWRKMFAPDYLKGMTKFAAVVLTVEEDSTVQDIVDKVKETLWSEVDFIPRKIFKFKARIPELHASIPDPCDYLTTLGTPLNSLDDLPDEAIAAIEQHPTFVAESSGNGSFTFLEQPNVGDIVEVEFEVGPQASRLRGGTYVRLIRRASVNAMDSQCALSLNELFGAELDQPPGYLSPDATPNRTDDQDASLNVPDDISRDAAKYDSGEISDPRFSIYKSANDAKIRITHPDLVPYLKCFIVRAWELQEWVTQIYSTYRTWKNQEDLHTKDSRNAEAGTSWHNYGLAFDVNMYQYPEGETSSSKHTAHLRKNTSDPRFPEFKSVTDHWLASGIPNMWKEMVGTNYSWGGAKNDVKDYSNQKSLASFTSYVDCVHFDTKGFGVSVSTLKSEIDEGRVEKSEANQIDLSKL